MTGKLILQNNLSFDGVSFGKPQSISGEMVFSTGMVGYPESFTDPSYKGQILILTYPIIGNYGVPEKKFWESEKIQIAGLVVSNYIDTPSHSQSKMSLGDWLKRENIPALEIKDTRFLAKLLRTKGACLGKIVIDKNISWRDPNQENLVSQVSTEKITKEGKGNRTIILIDLGAKKNIARSLIKRNVQVITTPWDLDPFEEELDFDGIVISNGPGDPKMAKETINIVKKALLKRIPTLGICLGNQILALAGGGDTRKLKFGHRSQNQPCKLINSEKCYITTQNHGFAVSKIPNGFKQWFINANDNTNEGLIHKNLPFMSVQFHPESTPGPYDTEWIFDFFLKKIKV